MGWRFYKGIILMKREVIDYPKELYFIKAFYKIKFLERDIATSNGRERM